MAHREQHGNKETKKPKKDRPKDDARSKATRWVVSEKLEPKADSKH